MSQTSTHLKASFLSSTKELQNLHNQIMDLATHYKLTSSHYLTKIKYRMKESINTANCIRESKHEFERKMELQNAFSPDDLRHQSLDQKFKQLFIQEYVEKSLKNKVILNDVFAKKQLQDAKVDAYPHSGNHKNEDNLKEINDLQSKKLQILSKENQSIHINSILFDLEKQKNLNNTLQKEIELLQNQYDSLETYCKAQKQMENEIQQDNLSINTDKHSLSEKDQEELQDSQEEETDEDLSHQMQCLQRLIKSKSQLVSQLEESNHSLRLKTNQLKTTQAYLNKKRMHLENSQRPKLQKQLNQLLESLKSQIGQNLDQKFIDQPKKSTDRKEFTQKLLNTAKQLSSVSHLIDSSLKEEILKQKLHSIQNNLCE